MESEIVRRSREDEVAQRLMTIPGIRPLIAKAVGPRRRPERWLLPICASSVIIKRHVHVLARSGTSPDCMLRSSRTFRCGRKRLSSFEGARGNLSVSQVWHNCFMFHKCAAG